MADDIGHALRHYVNELHNLIIERITVGTRSQVEDLEQYTSAK